RLKRRELPVALMSVAGRDPNNAVLALCPGLNLRDAQPRINDSELGVVLGASQVGITSGARRRAQAGRQPGNRSQGNGALEKLASLNFHRFIGLALVLIGFIVLSAL